MRTQHGRAIRATCSILVATFLLSVLPATAKDDAKEEGVLKILFDGKEIGREKYVLAVTDASASSSSVVDFRNPADTRQRIEMESKLDMDAQFLPRSYRLTRILEGKTETIKGTFAENTAMFEYSTGGVSKKSGVLVGKVFTILDTNVFHHFMFIARLYDFNNKEKLQRFEVAVPQEGESGFLKVSRAGDEAVPVRGKKIETHHLQVDSGSVIIDLWVDKDHRLHKIAVTSLKIEVVRD